MPCTNRTGFCPKVRCAAAGWAASARNAAHASTAVRSRVARACIISPHRCTPETTRHDDASRARMRRRATTGDDGELRRVYRAGRLHDLAPRQATRRGAAHDRTAAWVEGAAVAG